MVKSWRRPERVRRDEISRIVTFANLCIWSVLFAITFVFVKVTLKDVPLSEALSNANPQYIQAVVLSVYITCWALGCTIDTVFQSWVYLVDPEGGRVRLFSIIPVAMIAIMAAVLLWVRANKLYFSEALLGFTTVDIAGWLYLRFYFLPPIIAATKKDLEHSPDYYGLVLLKAVTTQVIGNWKWIRQIFLYLFVFLMVLIAMSPSSGEVGSKLAAIGASALTGSNIAPSTMAPLLSDLLLIGFLLFSEVWHFGLRARTFLIKRVLAELEHEYTIRPR